ncbi:hypothetical protein [Granulicella arctica]|uniref:hypothetical protein n=1 Tax=Granulicella arctica TaxID=940613 RepID=UPI0021E0C225|nr:hypothetical protein [Granulicella arctica]
MTEITVPEFPDFDTMTRADFEKYLPDFFAASSNGKVSSDPRLQRFLANNPDAAALVSDLEIIAEQARGMFNTVEEPSEGLWDKIVHKMGSETAGPETK